MPLNHDDREILALIATRRVPHLKALEIVTDLLEALELIELDETAHWTITALGEGMLAESRQQLH
jgi:hypothetical protein